MKFTREQIWRHNGLLGSTRMAYLAMISIRNAPTTTQESVNLAREAEVILARLSVSLKTRTDKE